MQIFLPPTGYFLHLIKPSSNNPSQPHLVTMRSWFLGGVLHRFCLRYVLTLLNVLLILPTTYYSRFFLTFILKHKQRFRRRISHWYQWFAWIFLIKTNLNKEFSLLSTDFPFLQNLLGNSTFTHPSGSDRINEIQTYLENSISTNNDESFKINFLRIWKME